MDTYEKTIGARMPSQAQSTAPKSGSAGGRISGDNLARVLTPALGMNGQQTASGLPRSAGPKSELDIAHLMSLVRAIQRLPRLGTPPDQQTRGEYRSENPDARYQYAERAPHADKAQPCDQWQDAPCCASGNWARAWAQTKPSQRQSMYPWQWAI